MPQLQLNNIQIPFLALLLHSIPELPDRLQCARRRIIKSLLPIVYELDLKREALQLKYCIKSVDNKPVLDAENKLSFTDANKAVFTKEWGDLNKQQITIPLVKDNTEDWKRIKTILCNYQIDFIKAKKDNFSEDDEQHCSDIEELVKLLK